MYTLCVSQSDWAWGQDTKEGKKLDKTEPEWVLDSRKNKKFNRCLKWHVKQLELSPEGTGELWKRLEGEREKCSRKLT